MFKNIIIKIRIIPRASKSGIGKSVGERLKIRLTAAPVDGKANMALISFLAKQLKVSKSSISIIAGHTCKDKTIQINNINPEKINSLYKPSL